MNIVAAPQTLIYVRKGNFSNIGAIWSWTLSSRFSQGQDGQKMQRGTVNVPPV